MSAYFFLTNLCIHEFFVGDTLNLILTAVWRQVGFER